MPADAPADVVFALTGDVRRNSRALRQLRVLTAAGWRVCVLTFGPEAHGEPEAGVQYEVLPKPPGGGPRFFARVHRLMRDAARARPARIYHASDLFVLPALYAAARAHDARLVYDARELYPFVGATAGKPWSTAFWYLVERFFIRRADAVFTVNGSIAERLAAMYGIANPTVLPNIPPMQRVTPTRFLRDVTGIDDATVLVLYQGYLRPWRGCEVLVEALADVPGAALVFLGEGPLRLPLAQQAEAFGLADRVHFVPMVPPDELLGVTASADIGACLTEGVTLSQRLALPNKLFEYLMAGLPVLASDGDEIRRVVDGHDVGLVVDPSDRDAVADALRRMVTDADARRRWAAHAPRVFETFSWAEASQHFRQTYQRLLTDTAS